MARGYEDLSRRALIKLGHDFDQEHDGELMRYLAEHDTRYESIRPVEALVQRTDQLVETISNSRIGIKTIVDTAAHKVVNKVADTTIENADKIICAAGSALAAKLMI